MTISIYFTKPVDTAIAAEDSYFIEALESSAVSMANITVANDPDTADIVLIDERYQYRTWHYADDLVQCSLVQRHAERICVINHDDNARIFLPGLYVSLEKSHPPLIQALPIPYKRDLWQIPVPETFDYQPENLFAFRGAFHTHPVRKQICQALSQTGQGVCEELHKAFHSHDKNDQQNYIDEIRNARFSLCPRGISPSTYRLYESMQLGRCPVVISDDWVAPPGPDWDQFAIFVAESDIRHLPEILMREASHAEAKGQLAQQAWEDFFSWPYRWRYFLEQVINFQDKKQRVHGFDEFHEIWSSPRFRRHYQWTLTGRAKQWLLRKYRALTEQPVP